MRLSSPSEYKVTMTEQCQQEYSKKKKEPFLIVQQSSGLSGQVSLAGAKNAVLVSLASLLLAEGISVLHNVPASQDVHTMLALLKHLGVQTHFDEVAKIVTVDTRGINRVDVCPDLVKQMRASVLVMGPLLARFGAADVAVPGGCSIGSRPIEYHLSLFAQMGVKIMHENEWVCARVSSVTGLQARRLVLEYPSVGATENILMAATVTPGITTIVNAALEPEVLDLVALLKKMGAHIAVVAPAMLVITGIAALHPVEHTVIVDRLEAGTLLCAVAATGGHLVLPDARAYDLDIFLEKLRAMGHSVTVGTDGVGVELIATANPRAVSFKTGPYPGFPTDLQAPFMVLQAVATGKSLIEETVFENRLMHVPALCAMGAAIVCERSDRARVTGGARLQGAAVAATDIRASAALVIAGLIANGETMISEVHHWLRGYDGLQKKLNQLGAHVQLIGQEYK